ncbi:MAG: efflux RND transporter permease subunit [Deltaproteobacteria bacterium]|nr:efflux RND transporter permease subunit [Deltaproteobacteria bacterium]
MNFIKFSILKPVTVFVIMLLIALFGALSIFKLPIQLTPNVQLPQITVRTTWPGASPYEIEKEVIEEQESVLKSVSGLKLMESSSYNNSGEITLTFQLKTNIDEALLRVSNKLNEVQSYPDNVNKPTIDASGAQSSPIIWTVFKIKKDTKDNINHYKTFFENEIRQHFERIKGVGSLFVFGGTENQLQIIISPAKLAEYNLTIKEVISKIQSANINISAGLQHLDKNNYRIRTINRFNNDKEPLNIVLKDNGFNRVHLKDIAYVKAGYENNNVVVRHNGEPVIVMAIRNEQSGNVIAITEEVKKIIKELNATILKDENLYCQIVNEQTPYISKAISLVKNNVAIGAILAITVLFLFLRNFAATLTIAIAIPISVIGSFIFMKLFNRTINVVSLAGISFAVGMLIDNAIVTLENIDRHKKEGKSSFEAAYIGTKEVWGAVFASTITTIAVFLPVIFMEEEAGQLFKDIAIAITFAIIISLFVSVSAIPTISNLFYSKTKKAKPIRLLKIEKIGEMLSNFILKLSKKSLKSKTSMLITVLSLTAASLITLLILTPKAEYLPQGNRNFILNILIPPPGYSIAKRNQIGDYIFKTSKPYFEEKNKDNIPQIENMFFVSADRFSIFGASSVYETEAKKMMPLFTRIINSIPGMIGVSTQAGIFQSGIGKGRTVEVNIAGENINKIIETSRALYGAIKAEIPNAQIRPVPSFENSYPEANFIVNRSKAAANGFTEQDIGLYIDVIMDGRKIDEFKPEDDRKVDLILKYDQKGIKTPEDIADTLIANKYGQLVPIKDIARLNYDQGMMQIDHLEKRRNITLQITPPIEMPLQQALETIHNNIIKKSEAQGKFQETKITMGGSAGKLTETIKAFKWNIMLAALIIYLLMSALFENFFYPFIIMFTLPLAGAGGFIGLMLINTFIAPQGFDILTMLGFIILIGTVVNNAILIVHQTLNNIKYNNLNGISAISSSVKTRIRPIFMSATTSILGMFPLVISTGAGSELYRGLGSVLLGGLAVSTIFTIFVIPALMGLFVKKDI